MLRLLTFIILIALLAVPAGIAAPAPPAAAPTSTRSAPGGRTRIAAPITLPLARGLVSRYLNAVGGRVALWDLKAFSAHATISIDGTKTSGELELAFRKPDLMFIRLDLGELGTSEVAADGRIAWELTTTAEGDSAEVISMSDAKRRRRELNWFELALRLTDDAKIFRTIAPAEFEGHPCWEIQKTTRKGNEERIFIDRNDFLVRGIRMIESGPLGEYEVTLSFRDWRRVKSLTLFHQMVISRNNIDLVVTFDKISLDPIPSQTFVQPPRIRQLLKDMNELEKMVDPDGRKDDTP